MTIKFNGNEIVKAMRLIEVDNDRVDNSTKGDIIADFKYLLIEEKFDQNIVSNLITSIYKIRCNIVHGTKTMNQMTNPEQRKRIFVYSLFLIAIQHMLFLFLEYLKDGYFKDDETKSFLRRLRESH